jgi:opacity protein-like surface antigen
MRKLVIALLFSAPLAFPAGLFSIGVKGGVPFTDAFNTATSGNLSYVTHNKYWTLGPEFDVNLPFGIGVEIDALYQRLAYESTGNVVDGVVHSATTANAWDFPLLLKWKFAPGPIRPYISVGPTFRGLSNLKQVTSFFSPIPLGGTSTTSSPAELQNRFNTGFTLGGGLQLLGHISPEIRYTRWGWDNFRDPSGLLKTSPNQVAFLVGLTF